MRGESASEETSPPETAGGCQLIAGDSPPQLKRRKMTILRGPFEVTTDSEPPFL